MSCTTKPVLGLSLVLLLLGSPASAGTEPRAGPSLNLEQAPPEPDPPSAAPEGGTDDLFVGRSLRRTVRSVHVTTGLETQLVPLNIALATSKDDLIAQSIATGCQSATSASCAIQAQAAVERAEAVIAELPDGSFAKIQEAASSATTLAASLRAAGITDPEEIKAVTTYVAGMPATQRAAALGIVRHATDSEAADIRMEPFLRVELPAVELRVGVPLSLGVQSGSGDRIVLGNVNLDAKLGWSFPVPHADLAIATGLSLYLPTATGGQSPSGMADLFQASKYLRDYLSLSPYVVGGADLRWMAIQAHLELSLQNRIRGTLGPASAQILQYGLGVVFVPRFVFSVVGELNGLKGLNNAEAYQSLFVVAGLRLRAWRVRFSAGIQLPLWDGASENLGSWAGYDLSGLARYTIVSRASMEF